MAKKAAASTGSKKPKTAKRISWLDTKSQLPAIEKYAKHMESYAKAFADGVITDAELKEQQDRLTTVMKEVEPLLDDEMHGKITHLLCELTVYDMMQILHAMHSNKPKTKFKG